MARLSLLFGLSLAFTFYPSIYGIGDNDKSDKEETPEKKTRLMCNLTCIS